MKKFAFLRLRGIPVTSGVRRGFSFLLLVAILGFAVGCGSGNKSGDSSKNEVGGKVTLGDKLVSGTVVFVYSDNKELQGPIGPDGSYVILDPTPGQVKIYIKASGLVAPAAKGGPETPKEGPASGSGVAPPVKYQSIATSGLTYEVKPGKQTHNLELK